MVETLDTPDVASILERLAAPQPNPDDDGNLSPNERAAAHARSVARVRLKTNIRTTAASVEEKTRELTELARRRDLLVDADTRLKTELDALPDWTTILDKSQRDQTWRRTEGLNMARRALDVGVEFDGGLPTVPHALKQILGTTTDRENREIATWYGSLPSIVSRVSRLERERAEQQHLLNGYLRAAEQLLVSVSST